MADTAIHSAEAKCVLVIAGGWAMCLYAIVGRMPISFMENAMIQIGYLNGAFRQMRLLVRPDLVHRAYDTMTKTNAVLTSALSGNKTSLLPKQYSKTMLLAKELHETQMRLMVLDVDETQRRMNAQMKVLFSSYTVEEGEVMKGEEGRRLLNLARETMAQQALASGQCVDHRSKSSDHDLCADGTADKHEYYSFRADGYMNHLRDDGLIARVKISTVPGQQGLFMDKLPFRDPEYRASQAEHLKERAALVKHKETLMDQLGLKNGFWVYRGLIVTADL